MGNDRRRLALILMAPAMAGLVFFVVVPFFLAVGLSFTDIRLGSPLTATFVGLKQYAAILRDPVFGRAFLNNVLFAAIIVPVQTGLALGLALLLNRPLRGMPLFRTLFFMPVVFPISLVAVVWILIFAPGPDGVLNSLLATVTFGAWTPVDFLHDTAYALVAVAVTSIWQGGGFQMVVLLAGLQSIDGALYEAAAMDGAGRFRQFRHVTLPGLRNPLVFVVIVTSILSFRLFDQVRIMTGGGPADATATVVFASVRAAFDRAQLARGAAMAVLFFIVVLALTLIQRRLFRQNREG